MRRGFSAVGAAILVISIMLPLLMVGCFGDPIKDDLNNYLYTQIPPLNKTEAQIIKDYESVTGSNYKDDATLYAMLNDNVIPNYEKFVTDLGNIKCKTVELQNIHQKWVDGAKIQLEGFKKARQALVDQDANEIQDANKLLKQAGDKIDEHNKELKTLADKYGMKVE